MPVAPSPPCSWKITLTWSEVAGLDSDCCPAWELLQLGASPSSLGPPFLPPLETLSPYLFFFFLTPFVAAFQPWGKFPLISSTPFHLPSLYCQVSGPAEQTAPFRSTLESSIPLCHPVSKHLGPGATSLGCTWKTPCTAPPAPRAFWSPRYTGGCTALVEV